MDQRKSPEPVSLNIFDQIDALCGQFRSEWKQGQKPSIDEYLDKVEQDARFNLFRNLLHLDIECRRRIKESPSSDEYLRQYPEFGKVIRQAFFESTMLSMGPEEDTSQYVPTVSFEMPAANRLGDYLLVKELGRGGCGVVYEGQHEKRGNRVALKTLPTGIDGHHNPLADAKRLHKFRREFRALADVNHPNLVGLQTLEVDGTQWFITMDLVEGVDILTYVRPDGTLDEERLRKTLAQLVAGVMALHSQQIVHRDLKPSNVLVTDAGRVVILDFGLVAELEQLGSESHTGRFQGTPAYAAPEQLHGERTFATDWYAVGVVLYEAMIGQRPFNHPDHVQLLRDKQVKEAPSIVGQNGVPDDLGQLCMTLLARDPSDRPAGPQISKLTGGDSPGMKPTTSQERPRLVGRETQLAELEVARRRFEEQRQAVTVFVSGRSGEGKSALVEQFLEPLRESQRYVVLSGRCYDRESVPFKALDSLIDALCGYLAPLSENEVLRLLPDDIPMLAHVFPVMQRVEEIADAPQVNIAGLDNAQVRQRAFGALRELLRRISNRRPVVMFIDDLQWGDADSAKAMFEVLRPPEAPVVLFFGSFRSDETDDSAYLQQWQELQAKQGVSIAQQDVKVGPLSPQQCLQLVFQQLGQENETIRARAAEFYKESGGNSFFLHELIDSFDPDRNVLERTPIHEVIDRKLTKLPAEAEILLQVVAVSGQAISPEEAIQAAGRNPTSFDTLAHMRIEKLVRLIGSDQHQLVDTYHDKVRETILRKMDQQDRKRLHRTIGATIESIIGSTVTSNLRQSESPTESAEIPRVFDLAYHFDAAGEEDRAWKYGLVAAEQARRQFALEVAAEQYAIAQRNSSKAGEVNRFRIAAGYSEALMMQGRYHEASQQADDAINMTDEAIKKARIESIVGEIAFKAGELNKSIASFESGLRRLGNRVPATLFGYGTGLMSQTVIQTFHTLLPYRLHKRTADERDALTNQLFNRLTNSYMMQNVLKMLWTYLAGMNRAERFPPSRELAFNYAMSALLALIGWNSRALKYISRSLEIRGELNDVWGLGHSYSWRGVSLYASGNFEESIANLTKAVDSFSRTGDQWELNLARFHLGFCHYRLGNLDEAVRLTQSTFRSSVAIGDTRTHCSLFLWSRSVEGNLPFEELTSRFQAVPEEIMPTSNLLIGQGRWHLFHHRTEKAIESFQQAGSLAMKNLIVNFHTVSAFVWIVTALRQWADEQTDSRQRNAIRKQAWRRATWAARLTRVFKADYPHAMRELAYLYADRGRIRKALKLVSKSCAVAEKQKAKYEYAQSALLRASLKQKLGMPGAAVEMEQAEATMQSFQTMIQQAVATVDSSG